MLGYAGYADLTYPNLIYHYWATPWLLPGLPPTVLHPTGLPPRLSPRLPLRLPPGLPLDYLLGWAFSHGKLSKSLSQGFVPSGGICQRQKHKTLLQDCGSPRLGHGNNPVEKFML